MKKSTLALLMALALAAVILAGTGCAPPAADAPAAEEQDSPQQGAQQEGPQDIGQGGTVFAFEVTDGNGETTAWNVHTDASIVGDALLEVGLIEGEESGFGLMVIYVDGIRADYHEDGAYWAFFIDGEYAMEGVDATEIEQGRVYAFVYTDA